MQSIYPGLWSLLVQLPLYVMWLIGIGVAAASWRRHPRVSGLTMVGLLAMLIISVISNLITPWLQSHLLSGGIGPKAVGITLMVKGFVTALLLAIGWIFILIAIFSRRHESGVSIEGY